MEDEGFIGSHSTLHKSVHKLKKTKEYGTMFRFQFTPEGNYENMNNLSVDPIRQRCLTICDKVNILIYVFSYIYELLLINF